MTKIKIKEVSLHNFKGFEELRVDFKEGDAVVLGGPNGYGKSTIFDALELLFTGVINRLKSYSDFHDRRANLSLYSLPLVCSKNSDEVWVSALLQKDDQYITIKRSAKVEQMKNPVDFTVFTDIMSENQEGLFKPLSEEELSAWGLDDFAKHYDLLNYLSQEEATSFLKQKEADRAQAISQLFNLELYDVPLKKIEGLIKKTKGKKKLVEDFIKNKNEEIKTIQQIGHDKRELSPVGYKQLCQESPYWDVENPSLSYDQYHSFLAQNGIMDQLLNYCKHAGDYEQYRRNQYIDNFLDINLLNDVAFLAKYSDKAPLFNVYEEYKKKVIDVFNVLQLSTLSQFNLNIPDTLKIHINDSYLTEYETRRESLLQIYSSSNAIQKELNNIFQSRDELERTVLSVGDQLPQAECPLCGQKYNSVQDLTNDIQLHGKAIRLQLSNADSAVQVQFEQLRQYIKEYIIMPLDKYFETMCITSELSVRYKSTKNGNTEKILQVLKRKLIVEIDKEQSLAEISHSISLQLTSQKKEIPQDVDYKELTSIYDSYARFITPENLNEENLKAKMAYLQICWNQQSSSMLQQKQDEKNALSRQLANIELLKNNLSTLKKELTKQRQAYLRKVIQDIKILFYIYTGRIMQTNYFGRGLFINTDESCKNIMITCHQDSAVDALYNMSSGQLASIAIALLLSLNKLYSNSLLLAIDDPIQTIDDMNVYGLIETLRHDFKDHFILLSTHERDYGDLLVYKFRKMGINSEVIDMAEVESKR